MTQSRIIVEPSCKWRLQVTELQALLENVRDVFDDLLVCPPESGIIVRYCPSGPRVLHKRADDGSYIVLLFVSTDGYGQPIFQFAHEYGHILSNYRFYGRHKKQIWFEESICALASAFALKGLQTKWNNSVDDMARNVRAYHVGDYFKSAFGDISRQSNFAQWYRNNREELENIDYHQSDKKDIERIRKKNDIVAIELLDIFEKYPTKSWNAVRYMNQGHISIVDESLTHYLNDWRKRTPEQWQFIIGKIMKRFEIS